MASYLLGAAAIVAVIVAAEVIFIEPRCFRVRHQQLACRRATGKLSVLHVSDFHFRARDAAKLRFVKHLAEREVDIVAITGDLIDETDGIGLCVEAVAAFRPRLGMFAVLGGHDYYFTRVRDIARQWLLRVHERHERVDTAALVRGLEEAGARVVTNERVELDHEGMKVDVIGVDDPRHGRPDLDAAFAGARADALQLALVHEPSVVEELAERGPDVVLAGHTHGGQVRLPGIGALVTQAKLHRRHAAGVFRRGRTWFHLNHGIGTGRYVPFRIFCRPEATVIEIVSE